MAARGATECSRSRTAPMTRPKKRPSASIQAATMFASPSSEEWWRARVGRWDWARSADVSRCPQLIDPEASTSADDDPETPLRGFSSGHWELQSAGLRQGYCLPGLPPYGSFEG